MLNENFLALYNEELRYLREDGQHFAHMHPQVAQHLGLHADGVLDPFVERLLEGTAFLSSRIQQRLNNEHPEFALQMLERLAPFWYTPLPAIATISLIPDLTSPQWHSNVVLAKGSRVTLSDSSLNNRRANFSTGRNVKLQPLTIESAGCSSTPPAYLPQVVDRQLQTGRAYISLRFTTQGVASLSELGFSPMNLTLAAETIKANQLLTALLNNTQRIVLWAGTTGEPLVNVLTKEHLRLGGISEQEALLPMGISELPGSRLLREYFAAPSRFFDIELQGIDDFLQQGEGIHRFEMVFVLDQRPLDLIGQVNGNDFRLFATPIINLFKRRCSPVLINGEHTEYPVVVDPLNPALYEIHHIMKVDGLLNEGGNVPFSSLHGYARFDDEENVAGYSVRRRRQHREKNRSKKLPLPHDSLFITVSPGASGVDIDQVKSLSIEALVCERHLVPHQLQQPEFQLDVALPVGQIEMIRHPSKPQGVPNMAQAWQVLQLITNNPLRYALPEVPDCSPLVKDWLSLFCLPEEVNQYQRITSLLHASMAHNFERHAVAGPIAWSRGVEATLNFSSSHHSDKGAFLFARIMHHALSEYCELGQTLRMKMQLDGETFAEWGPALYD